jgi:hypothetical protein
MVIRAKVVSNIRFKNVLQCFDNTVQYGKIMTHGASNDFHSPACAGMTATPFM